MIGLGWISCHWGQSLSNKQSILKCSEPRNLVLLQKTGNSLLRLFLLLREVGTSGECCSSQTYFWLKLTPLGLFLFQIYHHSPGHHTSFFQSLSHCFLKSLGRLVRWNLNAIQLQLDSVKTASELSLHLIASKDAVPKLMNKAVEKAQEEEEVLEASSISLHEHVTHLEEGITYTDSQTSFSVLSEVPLNHLTGTLESHDEIHVLPTIPGSGFEKSTTSTKKDLKLNTIETINPDLHHVSTKPLQFMSTGSQQEHVTNEYEANSSGIISKKQPHHTSPTIPGSGFEKSVTPTSKNIKLNYTDSPDDDIHQVTTKPLLFMPIGSQQKHATIKYKANASSVSNGLEMVLEVDEVLEDGFVTEREDMQTSHLNVLPFAIESTEDTLLISNSKIALHNSFKHSSYSHDLKLDTKSQMKKMYFINDTNALEAINRVNLTSVNHPLVPAKGASAKRPLQRRVNSIIPSEFVGISDPEVEKSVKHKGYNYEELTTVSLNKTFKVKADSGYQEERPLVEKPSYFNSLIRRKTNSKRSIINGSVKISCEAVQVVGIISEVALSLDDIRSMTNNDLSDCLEIFGTMSLDLKIQQIIWERIKKDLTHLSGRLVGCLTTDDKNIIQTNFSTPWTLEMLSTISHFNTNASIMNEIVKDMKKSSKVLAGELVAMGPMICRLSEVEIETMINPRTLFEASRYLGNVVPCEEKCLKNLYLILSHTDAYGDFRNWTSDDVEDLGVIATGLPDQDWIELLNYNERALIGLTTSAARCLKKSQVEVMSEEVLSSLPTLTKWALHGSLITNELSEKQRDILTPWKTLETGLVIEPAKDKGTLLRVEIYIFVFVQYSICLFICCIS